MKFIVKVRDIHKTEKNNSIGISVFGYENKKDIQSVCQIILSRDILIYYWLWKKTKGTMFYQIF